MNDKANIPALGISEDRNFRMHPALLWSVIQAQAGTPEKALLEAVMNAVDAKASACDITINETGYRISDNGRGFRNRAEIEEFFETFGTPHKEGDATYGRFRMGRGQLFAFSTTTWRSGAFLMAVDIKARGLSYELQSDLPLAEGCAIEGAWYERMDRGEVIRVVYDLTQLAQWMQIAVTVNGHQINKLPAEQKWSLETDDAYFSLKSAGGLAVYNLGALVRVYPSHQFGVSGVIVTKMPLQVNFARNDILLSSCKVWARIRRELDVMCGNLVKKKSLSDYERDAIAMRFVRGEIALSEIRNLGLIEDVSGKKRSLSELLKAERLCVVPDHKDWTIGERVMEQKIAFVIRLKTLHRFKVETPEELLAVFQAQVNIPEDVATTIEALRDAREWREWRALEQQYPEHGVFDHINVVSLKEVSAHVNDTYELIPPDQLTPHQKAFHLGLQNASKHLAQSIRYIEGLKSGERNFDECTATVRQVVIGRSDVADAWTDGETIIAIDIELINRLFDSRGSILGIVAIMLHEYCHNEPDQGGHVHDVNFYELFHELTCGGALSVARWVLLDGYAKAIAELGKKPKPAIMQQIRHDSKKLGDAQIPDNGVEV